MSLLQYAFRFFNDDGGEATSTPYAAENANISWPLDTNIRVRLGVTHDASAAPATSAYVLMAAPHGTQKWFEVTTTGAGKLRLAKTGGSPNNIPNGGVNTTRRLTLPNVSPTPTFVAGKARDDASGQDPVAIGNGQCSEFEWCTQSISANGAVNGDVYDFRVGRIDLSVAMDITPVTKWQNNGAGAVVATSGSIAVTAGDILLLCGSVYDGNVGDPAVTNSGTAITWNLRTSGANGTDASLRTQIWTAVAPATESITISLTPTPAASVFISGSLGKVTGATAVTLDGAAATTSGTGTSAVANVGDTSVSNGLQIAVASWVNTATGSAGSGYTVQSAMSYTDNSVCALTVVTRQGANGAFDPAVTLSSSDNWCISGLSLKP